MLKTRYEEYLKFKNKLPFSFESGIVRNKNICSDAVNWHDNLEIQVITDGSGYVLLNGERKEVEKNDIVVINSCALHYTGSEDEIVYDCLIIDGEFCLRSDIDFRTLMFSSQFKSTKFLEEFHRLKKEYAEDNACRTAKLTALLLNLLVDLNENHLVGNFQGTDTTSFETVKSAIKYILSNFEHKLSLDEIARRVYTDKYTLSHKFKKLTGQSVIEYVNRHRIRTASEYINSGMTVAEAARACGFENMSFFTRMFKRYMGLKPSEYKKPS